MRAPTMYAPRTTVHILGVPLDHGAGRRGVGMGPSALRIAKLHDALARLRCKVQDHGDIHVAAPETIQEGDKHAKFLPLITEVCTETAAKVREFLEAGGFPLVIGGDHSMAIGTISGLASYAHAKKPKSKAPPKIGVIWFDAHADINTPETTLSGNIHGMPVACLLGRGPKALTNIGYAGAKLDAKHVVQIGLRDLDDVERDHIRETGIHAFTMADIDTRGMADIMREAIKIATDGTDMFHVSFDIDALDPRVAPGTGTTKLGGLTYREAHLALEMVAASGKLSSFEMVEVNPTLDEQNRTAELAVGLIASALGKRIL